jgi:membrane protein DedA with SNARE-associated domain
VCEAVSELGQLVDRILGLHGWAVLAVVFLAPALEASAFLGVVIPGEIAVLLGGVLAFQHRAPLPAVLVAAVAGAIIGDSVGYLVGRRWGRRLLDGSVGRLVHGQHLDRAERYLAERGGPAVFFGRFTAALRALIPGLAGMAGLHYRTFAVYNAAGGALWAIGFVLLGYVAGTGWRRVEAVAKRASLLLLLALVAAALLVVAVRWLVGHPDRVRALADRQLARPWVAGLRDRYQRQLAFVARRLRPGGALGLSLTATVAALVAAGWAFGAVVQDVLARDELELVDRPVALFFVRHREAWLTRVMQDLTNLGSTRVLIPLILGVGVGWWLARRAWRPLAQLAAAYAGAELAFNAVKELVHRPRPPAVILLKPVAGPGFPSGHATQAVAVYACSPPFRPRPPSAGLVGSRPGRWLWSSWGWSRSPGCIWGRIGSPTCSAVWPSAPPGCLPSSPASAPSAGSAQTDPTSRPPPPPATPPRRPPPRPRPDRRPPPRPPWLSSSWSTGRWSRRSTTPPNPSRCGCSFCWPPPPWPPSQRYCSLAWPSGRCATSTRPA